MSIYCSNIQRQRMPASIEDPGEGLKIHALI